MGSRGNCRAPRGSMGTFGGCFLKGNAADLGFKSVKADI